jgi:hypothetical protein
MPQDRGEERADEALPDDEHPPGRDVPRPTEDAGERLHHRAVPVVDVVRQLDPRL